MSERDKGTRFERLMQGFLQTDPIYKTVLKQVWLWEEFPYKGDFGGRDTGIDLVGKTPNGEFWAVQCKCFQEGAGVDKKALDSFLSTSSRSFKTADNEQAAFAQRLWISTTNRWGSVAEEAIRNQNPPVSRLNYNDLCSSRVNWDELLAGRRGESAQGRRKTIRPHQQEALEGCLKGFKEADRGKMIMACGTGKTFTSLRIAEEMAGKGGLVLFLVPSIALLGQTLREWWEEALEPIKALCVCSDSKVGEKRTKNDGISGYSVQDLALPASTNVEQIVKNYGKHGSGKSGMKVVFSTYQSIGVISEAQSVEGGLDVFDLIICDEAHRTTGVTLAEETESAFVRVHDNRFIQAKKRLYMTATPRIYETPAKKKAQELDAVLCSMDDPELYGEEFYRIGFGRAVELNLLSDYVVLILTMREEDVPTALQKSLKDSNSNIPLGDVAKLVGCINGLSKQILGDQGMIQQSDPQPMRRGVAFSQSIKDSKAITQAMNTAGRSYGEMMVQDLGSKMVSVKADHIDGTMGAPQRDELLNWLKADSPGGECRILNNVRCLSEGVDVPSLDAVLFLSPRNSKIDVVQSVGRVMRQSEGKKYGYIILPIVIPSDKEAHEALDDNKVYKVVWDVLNALRSHDERFEATVNKIDLNTNKAGHGRILIGRVAPYQGEGDYGSQAADSPGGTYGGPSAPNIQLTLEFEELQGLIYAKMVTKVGTRRYWEQWAEDVADIAQTQQRIIHRLISREGKHKRAFDDFLQGLQRIINPTISSDEAVEMLAQHLITQPVFEALFEDYSFVDNNPVSRSMQTMLQALEGESLEKETESLERFYQSVRRRAGGIDNAAGRQRIIVELYDKFFRNAFPQMVEKLGIVYTPVEVVDFIIHSVEDVLQSEFGRGLGDENVHILDPFTGTGTFITRLLQSGLIGDKDLRRKYEKELHANEIVLLAYYIAAINAENAYHDVFMKVSVKKGRVYQPFNGICLTDTFQLGEDKAKEYLINEVFPQNSQRVEDQKITPLRVIMGNPPYSSGQRSANDNAQNVSYANLEGRIAETYAARSIATNKNSLYDSYIKAFRWSADRLGKDGGVIAFVSNAGWLDGNAMDGFRKTLEEEFTAVYVFNLRGNARTSGEIRKKEAGNVFSSGSRTPIAITLLVKQPGEKGRKAKIYYRDIGDYLKRQEKLDIIRELHSLKNPQMDWLVLQPDKKGNWINQGNALFDDYFLLGNKGKREKGEQTRTVFESVYSRGLATTRDAWCYNYSKEKLEANIVQSINFYNEQKMRYEDAVRTRHDVRKLEVKEVVLFSDKNFSWSRQSLKDVGRGKLYSYDRKNIRTSLYRPFAKQNLYYSRDLNEMVYQIPKLFPTEKHQNRVICIPAPGGRKNFFPIITDCIPDLHFNGDTQVFPLYYYEEPNGSYVRREGVSDYILEKAQKRYGSRVKKEDVFYYVYGLLHSREYRKAFANDLKKSLPRIPLVTSTEDFHAFCQAGRSLANLHINYESAEPWDSVSVCMDEKMAGGAGADGFYRVRKMRFSKKGEKGSIVYNSHIRLDKIPLRAYNYVVNGKSAIEWLMDRYQVSVHKDSGIENDPNQWCEELGNPRYILDLLLSVVTVSIKTVDIVEKLPGGIISSGGSSGSIGGIQ